MKLRHAPAGHDSSHGIDLAPMLDFVVNLLIFFIITAVFVKESVITVGRPSAGSQGQGQPERIDVRQDGEILFNGRTVDPRAVRANVERVRATRADSAIVILADEGAPTGAVVEVADQVRLGGINDITFIVSAAPPELPRPVFSTFRPGPLGRAMSAMAESGQLPRRERRA
jgi:biopolymer transport protein ExbD